MRAQILGAEFGLFGGGDVADRTDRTANELAGVGEVVDDAEATIDVPLSGCNVVGIRERVGRHVQDILQISSVVDEVLGDVGQPCDLFGGLVSASGDKALHLDQRGR